MTVYDVHIDEEDEQHGKRKWLTLTNVILISLFLLMILGKGRLGTEVVDKAFLYSSWGFLLFFLAQSVYAYFFHWTAKIVWNGGHSTTTGFIDKAGNFSIVWLDGIDAKGLKWQKNAGFFAAPMESMFKKGRSIVSFVKAYPRSYEELPDVLQKYIRKHNMKPPYIVGYIASDQYNEVLTGKSVEGQFEPKIAFLEHLLDEANKSKTFFKNLFEHEFGAAEDLVDVGKRMTKRSEKEKSILDRVRGNKDD